VKNLTVSVPDEVYRVARVRAAEQGSSVSALVSGYLRSIGDDDAEFARLEMQQSDTLREIKRFNASDRMSRDELHSRAIR
jgi:plasmid stability protein